MKRFQFCSLLLPCLNVLLAICNGFGIGTLNTDSQFLNANQWFVWIPFVAVDSLVFFVGVLDVFGIINFIFFSIIVNSRVLKNLGLKRVMLSAVLTSFVSYFILCIPTFELRGDWFASSVELAFLFSVLPTVIAICIRYVIWKVQKT